MCDKTLLNKACHLLAVITLVFGLWYHSISVIIAAVVVALIGHLTQILSKKPERKIAKKRR